MTKLTERERAALSECAHYHGRGICYWWRRKSMADLAARGLVEPFCPPSVAERPRMKSRPFRPTEAGRLALSQEQLP